jgi:hypothetical protein
MKVNIKGSDWDIIVLNNTMFNKKFQQENCCAITIMEKRSIVFNKALINTGIIRHELMHAIIGESHTESAMLDPVQIEEVCASIVENQWHNINMWTEQIIDQLVIKGKQ